MKDGEKIMKIKFASKTSKKDDEKMVQDKSQPVMKPLQDGEQEFIDKEISRQMEVVRDAQKRLDTLRNQADTATRRIKLFEFIRDHEFRVDVYWLLERIYKIREISNEDSALDLLESEILNAAENEKERMGL